MRHTLAALMLLLFIATSYADVLTDVPKVPQYFEVVTQIEKAFPLYYRGATAKNMVHLDVKLDSDPFRKPVFNKHRSCSWTIKGAAVTSKDTTAYFRGFVVYKPEAPASEVWRVKLRYDFPPIADEMAQ